jgi:hypothetical protein
MSIEEIIIRMEQVASILDAISASGSEYADAAELSQDVIVFLTEQLKPYLKM